MLGHSSFYSTTLTLIKPLALLFVYQLYSSWSKSGDQSKEKILKLKKKQNIYVEPAHPVLLLCRTTWVFMWGGWWGRHFWVCFYNRKHINCNRQRIHHWGPLKTEKEREACLRTGPIQNIKDCLVNNKAVVVSSSSFPLSLLLSSVIFCTSWAAH